MINVVTTYSTVLSSLVPQPQPSHHISSANILTGDVQVELVHHLLSAVGEDALVEPLVLLLERLHAQDGAVRLRVRPALEAAALHAQVLEALEPLHLVGIAISTEQLIIIFEATSIISRLISVNIFTNPGKCLIFFTAFVFCTI